MRVLVAYYTQTGNTEKVARAIFEEIDAEKELKRLEEVDSLEGYDLAFIGFPINGFQPAKPAREFLEKHAKGRTIPLFVTHASHEDIPELQGWLEKCREPAAQANLVGFFHCQGELSEQIAEFLKKQEDPKLRPFGEMRPQTVGQPAATRLRKARPFARETLDKLAA